MSCLSGASRSWSCLLFALLLGGQAWAQEIIVTLLGTGSPTPAIDRFGPSILIQAGDQNLVFDAGRGVTQRLTQAGVGVGSVDALFLTHLHSDHVVGIPDLWLTGWLMSRRNRPLSVFGPEGTKNMVEHLRLAFAVDVRVRVEEAQMPPPGGELRPSEVMEGVVYDNRGVRVTAITVDHRSIPAFGYRIDYGGRSVVLSGDTQPSPNLIEHAKGADLLVHEVYDATDDYVRQNPNVRQIAILHTSARQAGEVFQRIRPKLAVYSHIVLRGLDKPDLIARTRATYSGPLVVGEDLMRFVVGKDVTFSQQ